MELGAYRDYIERALKHADGSHTFDDVRDLVESGRLQFWPGPSSVVITEIIEYPRYKVLNFFLAGGNLVELEAMYPKIEEWGRSVGCDRAALTGRKGWERSFLTQKEGWQPRLEVFEKKFN